MSATEEAAFWAMLANDPTDDTARLVFADWLDDRSDPRSRWIRDEELVRYMRPGVATPLPALLDALRLEDYDVSEPALPLFGRLGEAALAPLLEMCQGEERTDERDRACRALASFDGELLQPHLPLLIRLLPTLGHHVCEVIAKIGPAAAEAVPALLEAEHDIGSRAKWPRRSPQLVRLAAGPAIPRLVTIMCWNDDASSEAADALVAIGPHTLDAALEGLNHVDHDYFYRGANCIQKYGEAAIPRLTEVLDEKSSGRRTGAVLALGTLAPVIAVPHLIEAVRGESSPHVLELLLNRITEMGPAAVAAAPLLRELLRKEDGSFYQDDVATALAAVTGDAGIPDLVAQLDDPDANFRRRTLRVLSKFAGSHPDARAALLRCATDPDTNVKQEALGLLGRVARQGDEDIAEPLRPCLSDPEADVRTAAANVLGRLKSAAAPAVPELLVAMRDPEEEVRIAATATVDGMQHEEPEMLGALLEALNDSSEAVRRSAAHGLQEWGHLYPEYTAAVFARVNDPDPDIARGATQLLGKATEPTPELIAYLRDALRNSEDPDLRVSAAGGLARLKVSDPELLAEVFTLFDETGNDALVESLVAIGTPAMPGLNERLLNRPDFRYRILTSVSYDRDEADTTPLLSGALASLEDEDSNVRSNAVQALAGMGQAAASTLPQLRKALQDPDQFVRSAAVDAITKVTTTPADVFPDVVRLLADDESYVRKNAVQALASLEVEPATKLPHILAALADPDNDVLQEAAQAAGGLGSAPELIPLLLPLLTSEEKWVRVHAADALGNLGDAHEVVPALRSALEDSDEWVRQRVIDSLAKLGPAAAEAIPDLVKLAAEDPDDDVRCSAAEALAKLGATEAAGETVEDLVRVLWASDGEQRAKAAQALGALGSAAEAAVPELARALRDPKWGDISKETKKKFTVMGMLMISLETIEAIGSLDQRIYVTTALREIGPPEAVIPVLIEALSDANALVSNSAAGVLRELLPASESAVRELLTHTDENVRSHAESVLAPAEEEPKE